MAKTGSDAQVAREIVSARGIGTLATVARDPTGYPFGSLVTYALDRDGNPLLLLSRLAEHTSNLLADPRASLMVAENPAGDEDPLAYGRVTLIGDVGLVDGDEVPGDDVAARDRFLAAHPAAVGYVDFPDFALYRLRVGSVRFVGGFGRMSWVDPGEYRTG